MAITTLAKPVFKLDLDIQSPLRRILYSFVQRPLERLLSLDALNDLYAEANSTDSADFAARILEALNISCQITAEDLGRIPKTGPVVVVANHPFGAIEGVILVHLLKKVRPDIKFMANAILDRVAALRELLILVNPFGGESAARANVRGLKQSIKWLEQGGLLAVFPAGEVSSLSLQRRCVTDPIWSDTVARIIRRTRSSVVPIFFKGANGPLFQTLGLIHPRLRTAMLPRQVFERRDERIQIRAGTAIPFSNLEAFETDADMTAYLRVRTYMLDNRAVQAGISTKPIAGGREHFQPVVAAGDSGAMAREVTNLQAEQTLLGNNDFTVFHASAQQIPHILREVGRLREITFRDTGEGTGKPIDLDEFDEYYSHLCVWNHVKHELVGAYRMGRSDEILDRFGKKGLYTNTLFNYKTTLLRQISPALELGRSFIRPEYQRSYAPLMLLWKGIGAYVMKFPRYKMLFGPVSITNDYHTVSRQLMVKFLQMHRFSHDLAKLVKSRSPFRSGHIKGWDANATCRIVKSVEDVSSLVAELENQPKGIPVLLKQYLKLGGQILGFSVDEEFADTLDALILVDLTRCDRRVLDRYMGKENAATFLAAHEPAAVSHT